MNDLKSPFVISKIIHYIHLIGVCSSFLVFLFLTTFTEFILFSTILINFLHPRHRCLLTLLENKYRRKAGLPKIKWFKHYITSKKPFRND